ncbi:MAG: chlorophyll synthase ChlG [Proteobacteria bacterium]|nr:chlorophyll synthase ChlG [Pseudomonadota bacterium]
MSITARRPPVQLAAIIELLKPITWFPPMWAFACGVVSSGITPSASDLSRVALGVLLAGPLVCGASQVVNDWFDRDVDAINEPGRPIPSGRIPGRLGLFIGIGWSLLSLVVAILLGPIVFAATLAGLALAWAYSAPPLRLKLNGWWGNAACGLCYEGLAWVTGAALMLGHVPPARILWLALLYSIAAHGIMTLNDFKSIDGDRQSGVRSLPVQLGAGAAAMVACAMMIVPQIAVVVLLDLQGALPFAGLVSLSMALQVYCMRRLLLDPRRFAPWYNATGVSLLVLGMLVAAIAVR